ncbi:transposase InsO family protein [Streptomyces sp. TE33382]
MKRCQFVEDHQRRFGVKRLCNILGVSRSSFCYWRRTAAARTAQQAAEADLAARIRKVHEDSGGTYGAPRITAELCDEGERINHKRVARVMRTIGLAGVCLRRRHRTTVPDPAAAKAPDLIGRDVTATEANTKYVGDVAYLPISGAKPLHRDRHRLVLTPSGRMGNCRSHANRARRRRSGGGRADSRQPGRGGDALRSLLLLQQTGVATTG